MGKGNSVRPAETQYQQAVTQAQTKSPEEEALSRAALKTLNWADKGDFRNPNEGGLLVNYADPAIQHRNRELQTNAGGQGIFAIGTPDPNYLATVKEHMANQNEQEDAAQYESDIREGIGRAAGIAGSTAGMDQARKLAVLGSRQDVYKNALANQRPAWWTYLLQSTGAAGAAFAGSDAGSAALAGI